MHAGMRGRSYSTVGGGHRVAVTAKYAAASGGFINPASGYDQFVGGGGARRSDRTGGNVASGAWSAAGLGGSFNKATGV